MLCTGDETTTRGPARRLDGGPFTAPAGGVPILIRRRRPELLDRRQLGTRLGRSGRSLSAAAWMRSASSLARRRSRKRGPVDAGWIAPLVKETIA